MLGCGFLLSFSTTCIPEGSKAWLHICNMADMKVVKNVKVRFAFEERISSLFLLVGLSHRFLRGFIETFLWYFQ